VKYLATDETQRLIDEKLKTWDMKTKRDFLDAWEKKDWNEVGRIVPPYDLAPLQGGSVIDFLNKLAGQAHPSLQG